MAKATTPVKPNATGKNAKVHDKPNIRAPLVTDMASAREHGRCSPSKGKTYDPGYKS